MTATNTRVSILSKGVFALMIPVVALLVFIENDEYQPILNIFQLRYLIPVLIYSLGSLWLCLGVFILLKKAFNQYIALASSLVTIPLGLLMVKKIILFLTEITPGLILKWFF
jgi:hypothetical protein